MTDPELALTLSTVAARNLASTTKTKPQMEGISSRWLLKVLPWVQVSGGVYRVNRRLSYAVGDGLLSFTTIGADVRVVPVELGELGLLRGFGDVEVLEGLARRFTRQDFEPGQVIVEAGTRSDALFAIVHGRASMEGVGPYGDTVQLGVLADGQFFGDRAMLDSDATWDYTVKAQTAVTLLALPADSFAELLGQSDPLRQHVERVRAAVNKPQNKSGEAAIELASGHHGEPVLPATYVDYEVAPREYELAVAQTVLRVHTRVADLFNEPLNQLEEQLRLTIEALRERQESEMVNNREFGLLHNVDYRQRIRTRTGPPTPDDLDDLLTMRRGTRLFLAHPRAIAAFGRECTRRGIYPRPVEINGSPVPAWRDIPIFPCGKIPISANHTTSILAMRTGEDDQGVVGLRQTGIPDEYEPSLSVRFMGIDDRAIMSYLVTAYFSAAVLVPDALGVLEDVQLSVYGD